MISFWTVATVIGVLVGAVIGYFTVPFITFFPPVRDTVGAALKRPLSTILWVVGAVVADRYVLDWAPGSGYDLRVVDERLYPRSDGEPHPEFGFFRDDQWVPLDDEDDSWSRFGLRPFGVTFDATRALSSSDAAHTAVSDGGTRIIERGGELVVEETGEAPDGKIRVRIGDVVRELREAAGSVLADVGEEVALEEVGGGDRTDSKVLAVAVLGALVAGFVSGIAVMLL